MNIEPNVLEAMLQAAAKYWYDQGNQAGRQERHRTRKAEFAAWAAVAVQEAAKPEPKAERHGGVGAFVVHGEDLVAGKDHADGVSVDHDRNRHPGGQVAELNQTAQQVQMMLGSRPPEPIAPPAADAIRKALESIKLAAWLLVLIVGYAVWR